MNESEVKVLDIRLANVEEAILEMKESQHKIGDALTELVKLASKNEAHREHIERRLDLLDTVEERLRNVEIEIPSIKLMKRGLFAAIGVVLSAAFASIWSTVTGGF